MSDSPGIRRFRARLMVLLVLALALGSYHWILGLDFTGLDAAPLLQANRFDGPGGPLACFTHEIRDGIEPGVAFYRPITGLSHGLDLWLHGLRAAGHHLTDLLLHAASALALLALLFALGASPGASLLGAAWFAIHPLGVEVVPCIARRAELWMGLWLLIACLGFLRRAKGQRGGATMLVLAGIMAPLSKETGAVLPALLFVLAPRGQRRAALLWGLALVAPALLARTIVLQGLGGYGAWSWQTHGFLAALGDLFNPARIGGKAFVRVTGSLVLVISLLAALRGREHSRPLQRFGLAWIALSMLPMIFARGISPWYLYTPLMGAAMLLAGLFASIENSTGGRRRVALALLVIAAALPAFLVSPMAVRYPEWEEISRQSAIWRASTLQLPDEFFEGPQLVAGLPFRADYPSRHGVRVRAASGLTDFSLRAWTQLMLDRDCDPHHAALAIIVDATPRYSIQASWIPQLQALRLQSQGPVELLLYGEEHPFEILEQGRGEIVIRDLQAPLWRWNGKRLTPVRLNNAVQFDDTVRIDNTVRLDDPVQLSDPAAELPAAR